MTSIWPNMSGLWSNLVTYDQTWSNILKSGNQIKQMLIPVFWSHRSDKNIHIWLLNMITFKSDGRISDQTYYNQMKQIWSHISDGLTLVFSYELTPEKSWDALTFNVILQIIISNENYPNYNFESKLS